MELSFNDFIREDLFNRLTVWQVFGSKRIYFLQELETGKNVILENEENFLIAKKLFESKGLEFQKTVEVDAQLYPELKADRIELLIYKILPNNKITEIADIASSVAVSFNYEIQTDEYAIAKIDFKQ